MKETIYTIPVNDAFAVGGFCPLCTLQQTLDEQMLEYHLGPSLMEPDVRAKTNELGFCRQHLERMYVRDSNRLGLGLMLHTHLSELRKESLERIRTALPGRRKGLFGSREDYSGALRAAADLIEKRAASCAICTRVTATMNRYLDVILNEYVVDPAFRQRFAAARGFCQPHTALLLRGAAEHLNQNQAADFLECLLKMQQDRLDSLVGDVEWFTLKYDYRNQDKDWRNSRDALPRAIRQLSGPSDVD